MWCSAVVAGDLCALQARERSERLEGHLHSLAGLKTQLEGIHQRLQTLQKLKPSAPVSVQKGIKSLDNQFLMHSSSHKTNSAIIAFDCCNMPDTDVRNSTL